MKIEYIAKGRTERLERTVPTIRGLNGSSLSATLLTVKNDRPHKNYDQNCNTDVVAR